MWGEWIVLPLDFCKGNTVPFGAVPWQELRFVPTRIFCFMVILKNLGMLIFTFFPSKRGVWPVHCLYKCTVCTQHWLIIPTLSQQSFPPLPLLLKSKACLLWQGYCCCLYRRSCSIQSQVTPALVLLALTDSGSPRPEVGNFPSPVICDSFNMSYQGLNWDSLQAKHMFYDWTRIPLSLSLFQRWTLCNCLCRMGNGLPWF